MRWWCAYLIARLDHASFINSVDNALTNSSSIEQMAKTALPSVVLWTLVIFITQGKPEPHKKRKNIHT